MTSTVVLGPADRSELLYLSQADAQMHRYVEPRQLRLDLINRLLLEPGLIMPDVFFFISERWADDINSPRSWIRAGLQHGLIVPAFRRESDADFASNVEDIRNMMTPGMNDERTEHLLAQLAATKIAKATHWPKQVGASYHVALQHLWQQSTAELNYATDDEAQLWSTTSPLRLEILAEAEKHSPNLAEDGIRRADLLRALAKHYNYDGPLDDLSQLLVMVPAHERPGVQAVVLWIHEVYHLNHATCFSSRPTFPVTNRKGASTIAKEAWEARQLAQKPAAHIDRAFEAVAPWPKPQTLLSSKPSELMEQRMTIGADFVAEWKHFRESPSPSAADWAVVRTKLEEYGEALCAKLNEPRPRAVRTRVSGAWRKTLDAMGAVATFDAAFTADEISARILGVTVFSGFIIDFGSQLIASRSRSVHVKMDSRDLSQFQIELPVLKQSLTAH